MQDLTVLRWQLEDGLFAGVGGKNFFDDFAFTVNVPEPTGLVLGGAWRRADFCGVGECEYLRGELLGIVARRRVGQVFAKGLRRLCRGWRRCEPCLRCQLL